MSVSEAERRRQERRQRILGNQEERLKKILGSNSNFERSPLTRVSADSNWHEDFNRESSTYNSDDGGDKRRIGVLERSEGETGNEQNSFKNVRFDNTVAEEDTSTTTQESFRQKQQTTTPSQLDSRTTVSSRQEENIKIPKKYHHVLLCLLSLFLTTFEGAYFLIYFVMYEFTIFALNGYSFSSFYSTKNSSLLTLSILFGVAEVHRNRFQKLTSIINWLSVDLTIFISSALLAALLYQLLL